MLTSLAPIWVQFSAATTALSAPTLIVAADSRPTVSPLRSSRSGSRLLLPPAMLFSPLSVRGEHRAASHGIADGSSEPGYGGQQRARLQLRERHEEGVQVQSTSYIQPVANSPVAWPKAHPYQFVHRGELPCSPLRLPPQYSSGSSIVVADLSASVIIQTRSSLAVL